MALPTVTQTWTMSLNNRYVFPSGGTTLGTMGALMFSIVGVGGFLPSTMGYTVKGSCDGTTGAMDGVNRISAANKWATRSTIAGAAQSWIVLTDGAGIDWLFTYQSAADDISRLSHSTGGNYIAAGTPAQQPTATDECFDATTQTWINATASIDRVWHLWGTTDRKMFRIAIYRNSTFISFIKGEKFVSALVSPATFTLAVGNGTVGAIKSFYNGTTLATTMWLSYSAATAGDLCRVHATGQDVNCKAGSGGELTGTFSAATSTFNSEKPPLQGGIGELIFPTQLGSTTVSADGKLGACYDQWFTQTTANAGPPSPGDTFGNLQLYVVTMGIIVPLDGTTTPVIA